MQSIYDCFSSFSYHNYTSPNSTEECGICLSPVSEDPEGLTGAVAHNDFNPHIEARHKHLHAVHKDCLNRWINEKADKGKTLDGRVECSKCRKEIDFRSIFPNRIPPRYQTLFKECMRKSKPFLNAIAFYSTALVVSNSLLIMGIGKLKELPTVEMRSGFTWAATMSGFAGYVFPFIGWFCFGDLNKRNIKITAVYVAEFTISLLVSSAFLLKVAKAV